MIFWFTWYSKVIVEFSKIHFYQTLIIWLKYLLQTAVAAVIAAAKAVLSAGRSSLPQKTLTNESVPAAAAVLEAPPGIYNKLYLMSNQISIYAIYMQLLFEILNLDITYTNVIIRTSCALCWFCCIISRYT